MSSFFRPKTTVVSVPSAAASAGSSEVSPYAPTIPFIDRLLPQVESEFGATPDIFRQPLVPPDAAQTLAGREAYEALGSGLFPQLAEGMGSLYQNRLTSALADPTQDPIYQAEVGTLSDQARLLTERDKALAQEQAIGAGQFGLGDTALAELQTLQQQKRGETTQRQLAAALQQAEARRVQAMQETPGLGRQLAAAAITPATIAQQIGTDVESRQAAVLADQARLQEQEQEARRLQLITQANLISGLAGLGTQTAYQGTTTGTQGQAFAGPSPFSQVAQAGASIVPFV